MKALTTHRLLDCFRKAVQEEESILRKHIVIRLR